MSGSYGASPPPGQPRIGPVRSPGGRVDVEVGPREVALTPHDRWFDWFVDSELVLALVLLVGLVVGLLGFGTGGAVGAVLVVVGALLFVPAVLVLVGTYAAIVFVFVQTALRLLTPTGRARLRRGAAEVISAFGESRGLTFARAEITVAGPVELGWRARLRLLTPRGDLDLTTARRHRDRLEAVAWALATR